MNSKWLIWLLHLWLKSLRVRIQGEIPQGILALWHQDLPACMAAFAHQGITVMISHSQDGELASTLAKKLGYQVLRGSDRRGYESLRHLLRALQKGSSVGMTLDGPKGPAGLAKKGCQWLQKKSSAPLVVLSVQYSMAIRISTWDRTFLPLPFSRILVSFQNEYVL